MTAVEHPQSYPTGRRLNLQNLECKKCIVAVKALAVTGDLPKKNIRSFGNVPLTEVKPSGDESQKDESMRESTLELADHTPLTKSNWRSSLKNLESPVEEEPPISLRASPLRRSSYDGLSTLPIMASSLPQEKVTRKVVENQGVTRYYIGEQEVSRDIFLKSI